MKLTETQIEQMAAGMEAMMQLAEGPCRQCRCLCCMAARLGWYLAERQLVRQP